MDEKLGVEVSMVLIGFRWLLLVTSEVTGEDLAGRMRRIFFRSSIFSVCMCSDESAWIGVSPPMLSFMAFYFYSHWRSLTPSKS